MNFKEKIEKNFTLFVLALLLSGFIAGFTTNITILSIMDRIIEKKQSNLEKDKYKELTKRFYELKKNTEQLSLNKKINKHEYFYEIPGTL